MGYYKLRVHLVHSSSRAIVRSCDHAVGVQSRYPSQFRTGLHITRRLEGARTDLDYSFDDSLNRLLVEVWLWD